jgi:hypothetical protein
MVDWFNPWPSSMILDIAGMDEPESWDEVKALLLPQLREKVYVKPGKQYVLITDFGESMVFSK